MAHPNILIVDENDKPIGDAPLKEAHDKGLHYRIVKAFVFNSKGELLIQKRGPNVLATGYWDQSVGGHVDVGEDYLDAIIRETFEEIGVRVNSDDLHEVGTYFSDNESQDESVTYLRFVRLYTMRYDGPVEFDDQEITEVRWVSLGELQRWIDSGSQPVLRGFINALTLYLQNIKK